MSRFVPSGAGWADTPQPSSASSITTSRTATTDAGRGTGASLRSGPAKAGVVRWCATTPWLLNALRPSGHVVPNCVSWPPMTRCTMRCRLDCSYVIARSRSPRGCGNDFPDDPEMWVSHEAIYQAIYVQGRGSLRRELHQCLRTKRAIRRPQHPPGTAVAVSLTWSTSANVHPRSLTARCLVTGNLNVVVKPPD